MGHRYYFEILDETTPDYNWFSYFDTEDGLAASLFRFLEIDVTIEQEFWNEEDPYRIILCRIPRKQREAFLEAIELIPGLMDYTGHTDYRDFCRNVMMDALKYKLKRGVSGKTPPQ